MEKKYPKDNTYPKGVWLKYMLEYFPELSEDESLSDEMESILNKLHRDEYVDIHTKERGIFGGMPYYTINFEGVYFIKYENGYQGLQNRKAEKAHQEAARNSRVEALETSQHEQGVAIVKLTKLAARGTIALVLWEILRYFVFEHHWYLWCR